MGMAKALALCVAALFVGCDGGSGGAEEGAPSGGGSDSARSGAGAETTRLVADPLIGYELALPEGWTAPAQREPGAAVPLGGGGQGCTVGTAGTLPALRDRADLIAYARQEAVDRAARGAVVEVEPTRGANVDGALARIGRRNAGARSALFASAGGGVAITCSARGQALRALDRGLAQLFPTVRLDRDPALERLQPQVASVPAVRGAALRREGGTVAARVVLENPAVVRPAMRAVLGLAAGALTDAQIMVTAVDPQQSTQIAVGRTASAADDALVQVGSEEPTTVALR
jgi:hypothetical protein